MEKLVFSNRRFDDWKCDAVIDLTQSQSAINQGKVETAGSDAFGAAGAVRRRRRESSKQ